LEKQSENVTEYNRADEWISYMAGFSEINPVPIAGMNTRRVITFASSASQKICKEPGFFKKSSIFVPDDKEEILHLPKESPPSRIYRHTTPGTACFPENIARINELPAVNFWYTLFSHSDKEEIKRRNRKVLTMGTSNLERNGW
jgi:hypothetical protein